MVIVPQNNCQIKFGAKFMNVPLGQLVDIRAGHPFRGAVPYDESGNGYVIQMRDVARDAPVAWPSLVRTRIQSRKTPDWLLPADIIFVARGTQNFALYLDKVPLQAVSSQYFFQLRVCQPAQLLPEFLAWQINSLPCQRYLSANAQGSSQLGIPRSVLEALPLAIPAVDTQKRLISLAVAARQEAHLLHALIHNRASQLDALALTLHTGQTE